MPKVKRDYGHDRKGCQELRAGLTMNGGKDTWWWKRDECSHLDINNAQSHKTKQNQEVELPSTLIFSSSEHVVKIEKDAPWCLRIFVVWGWELLLR